MDVLQVQGDAFSEYFLNKMLPQEPKLAQRLDTPGADRAWRDCSSLLRHAHRELRGSQQARVTRRALLDPLAELLSWRVGDLSTVVTSLGEEDGSQPLFLNGDEKAAARILAIPAEAALDLPPEGLHRRFAPAHSLVRILEQEGLTWGILLNAYELRLVRRSEGFVSSHLAFSLLDLAGDVPGARQAWHLLWGALRRDAWDPAPSVLDEVVRLGREHQQEIGSALGSQVPTAVERLLEGALLHPANKGALARFLVDPGRRRALLEHLHGGALQYLYRILFVLYAEARGLLPLDMPAYRDGYALSGARGLVRRVMNRFTDPRTNAEAATGFYESSLRALFRLLRDGADLGPEGLIPAYGGGLFYPHRDPACEYPELDDLRLGDRTIAYVLEALTHVQTKRGKVTLSYRELDVEQLGALYEGLLERAVDAVDEQIGPLWRIRLDGEEVLVTASQLADLRKHRGEAGTSSLEPIDNEEEDEPDEAEDDVEEQESDNEPVATGKKKPIRVLPATAEAPNPIPVGSVVLRPGLGRKQSGSYYTNRAFVEYLVRRAVDPIAEDRRPEEILKLSVCDPAMGSGHFLVGACRRLAEHLLAAYRGRYAEEKERTEAAGRDAQPHELLADSGIHAEVARVWGNEPAELAACRRLVAFHCLYGVDKNPLAVELARVSLWLATAASDHPLTFLNHRLVPGDSLLGITVEDLLRGFYRKKPKKALTGDEPAQGELPFYFSRAELDARLQRAFRHLREIERLETEQPGDFEDQQQAWLTMQQELAEFVDAHNLRIGRAFLDDDDPAADPMVANRWMQDIQDEHHVSNVIRAAAAAAIEKGKNVRAFCWELAFPELFFEPQTEQQGIQRRERPGFDAMVGNPPWDRVEPKRKEFFSRYDPVIRDFQGQKLRKRIGEIAPAGSEVAKLLFKYEKRLNTYAGLLTRGGIYEHQVAEIAGERTIGKPDLFKFFLERFYQLVRQNGRVSVLMPAGLCTLEGATGLRRLLLTRTYIEAIFSFENWGKRFFQIHASFKFLTLVLEKRSTNEQTFVAAFMLRQESLLALPAHEQAARSVQVSRDFVEMTSPNYFSFIELRDDRERQFVQRVYRNVPRLSERNEDRGAWNVELHREFNMGDDYWRFCTREWLVDRGATPRGSVLVTPPVSWYQDRNDSFTPGKRWIVVEGTQYVIRADDPSAFFDSASRSKKCRLVAVIEGFLPSEKARSESEIPVVAASEYVPLYEGRLVQQYDHAAKAYASGEGRGAKWRDVGFPKELVPHFYVISSARSVPARAGFCNVTGQTNERSILATIIPKGFPSGDTVPSVEAAPNDERIHLCWTAVANSFVADFLVRQKITTHLNFFFLETLPWVRPGLDDVNFERLSRAVAALVSTTPEIQLARPALDLRERARVRAEIDAIVAGLYGLSPAEFGYILTTFPLLDRDQPPLPDDLFVRWHKQGKPKPEPRSYVTRDTALLAYFRHRGITPPGDLVTWYRDEVQVNMIDDDSCPYRIGPIRNLEARVAEYHRRGAIAYVPSKAKKWGPNGPYQPPDLPLDWRAWIVKEPSICNGRPTLRGTRLELTQVQSLLEKRTFAEVIASYPQLDCERLAVALASLSRS